jgi:hypothetical protein
MLVVQLPAFLKIGQPDVVRLYRFRNTVVMALPMAVELITAIWLGHLAGLLLVLVIWAVTFALYVPDYVRLTHGHDASLIRRLIAWQWIRTLCWTGRSALLLWIAAARMNV